MLFTVVVFIKIMIENVILKRPDMYLAKNLALVFAFSALAIAILGASKFFTMLPLWLVIAGQYILISSAAMLETWISGHFQELAETAYRDMFRSVTIPFIIVTFVYYIKCFYDVHQANRNFEKLQEMAKK